MASINLGQKQKQSQRQTLSQTQIQNIAVLSLSQEELEREIYRKADENPVIQIRERDSFNSVPSGPLADQTRQTSRISSIQETASDNYQAMLENQMDERTTLQASLKSQINMMNLDSKTRDMCILLIENTDSQGHHILSPYSLSDRHGKFQKSLVDRCLEICQHLEPTGCCVNNTSESLMVQALEKENADQITLFILDGHLDYLDPPVPSRIAKKINDYAQGLQKQFALTPVLEKYSRLNATETDVQNSLKFIRTLDPFPARNFGLQEVRYVRGDLKVTPVSKESEAKINGNRFPGQMQDFILEMDGQIPIMEISSQFQKKENQNPQIVKNLKEARQFIESIEYRNSTLMQAGLLILERQIEFFEKGPGHLVPYTQAQLSQQLNVHQSTVSRLARNKYLQCEWGLFPLSFFFSEAASSSQKNLSRDRVMLEIEKIISDNSNEKKKLSDQKISQKLQELGMEVSRRTVAKYRSLLNVESSYTR